MAEKCARTGLLTDWLVPMFKEHAAHITPICSSPPYMLAGKYIVMAFALGMLVFHLLELIKNLTVRHDVNTIHTATGVPFFQQHPLINLKMQELYTVQFAFSVYSNFMLIMSILTDDFSAQISYLVVNAIMWVFEVIAQLVAVARGKAGGRNQALLDGLLLLVSAITWTFLVCNVNSHFGACTPAA